MASSSCSARPSKSPTASDSEHAGDGFGYGVPLHAGFTTATTRCRTSRLGLLCHDGVADDGFQASIGFDVLGLFGSK